MFNQSRQNMPTAKQLGNVYWRLNNLYYIHNKQGKLVKFELNWAQRELFKNTHFMNLILKARQLGVTTYWLIVMLDRCLFNSGQSCGLVAHKVDDAERLFAEKLLVAYDHLPDWLLSEITTTKREGGWLRLSNGSSIRVSTSMRSGTIQLLHISEFGKICAKFPDKAKEIVTGSLQAVTAGQMVVIESTAEGKGGYFYSYCMRALKRQRLKQPLTAMDYKLFFFPWHEEPTYRLDDHQNIIIPAYLEDYFERLHTDHGIELDDAQKAWYTKKLEEIEAGEDESVIVGDDDDEQQLAGPGNSDDMKREYPSYEEEAFEQTIEGAYYAKAFAKIHKEGRICGVPHVSGKLVDTWWDIGIGDSTCIWFTQNVGREIHIIDFYEQSGEGMSHYAELLKIKAKDRGFVYGRHVAPHDIADREFSTGKSRLETAREMGLYFDIAPKLAIDDGINACRMLLDICWFDEKHTSKGTSSLISYRKEWDSKNGVWRSRPLHNKHSHAADAFRTFGVAHTFDSMNPFDAASIGKDLVTAASWS